MKLRNIVLRCRAVGAAVAPRPCKVWQRMPAALVPFLLAACAALNTQSTKVADDIDQTLKAATSSRKAATDREAVDKALLPPVDLDWPKPSAAVEPKFDLSVNNASAPQVFMALVSGTRYSMLVSPEVSGSITVNLKEVTVMEALEALRDLYGYDFTVKGSRILVQPNTVQTRLFQINYLAGRRQGASEVRVSGTSITSAQGSAAPVSNPTIPATPTTTGGVSNTHSGDSARVTTSSDTDFWHEISTALNALIGGKDGRSIVINSMSGVILVRALPAEIRSVESYLKATQLMVERQVMLEAKIIEVTLNDQFQAGVNWAIFGSPKAGRLAAGVSAPQTTLQTQDGNFNASAFIRPGRNGALLTSTTDLGQGFFGLAFQNANFSALLNFLETQGELQILSSPRIASINNQKAVLKVGSDDFFVTNVTTTVIPNAIGTATTSPSITLQPFFSGIALDITPQIDENGMITLHVHPSISVVSEKQKQVNLGQLGVFSLPLASSAINETDSIVRVQDGNIVAIGGLMKQEQTRDNSQLPTLGDLPGIGTLFGQRSHSTSKSELVILIRPTVIQNEDSWRQGMEDVQAHVRADLRPAGRTSGADR